MAKISNLPALANPDGSEAVVVVQGGVSKRATLSGLIAGAVSSAVGVLNTSFFTKLYHRLWPEDYSFENGEFVFVVGQIAHPGFGFLVPRSMTMRRGRQPALVADPIANTESAYRARHSFVVRTPGAAGVLWYDGRNNLVRFDTHDGFNANLVDEPTGAYAQAYVLAVATADDQLLSPTGIVWRRDNEAVGRNQATWGLDITKVPYRYGDTTVVDVTDPVLQAYGFTKAIQGNSGRTTYVGALLGSTYAAGASVFIRQYWGTTEDNQFPADDLGVNIWNGPNFEGSGFVAFRKLKLETILSPRARIYSGWIDFPPNPGIASFSAGLGPPPSDTAKLHVAGMQFCAEGMPRDIRRLDFNVANAIPDLDLVFPPTIYMRAGRKLIINPANALSDLDLMEGKVATIMSKKGLADRPFSRSSSDTIELDPDTIGTTLTIGVQPRGKLAGWKGQTLAVRIGNRTDQRSLCVLAADSKSMAGLAGAVRDKYRALGGTMETYGTIVDGRGALTQACAGWTATDFTYESTVKTPLIASQRVPGYRTPFNAGGSPTANALLVPDDGSYDAGIVQNGYALDVRRYITDFAFPDFTDVICALGVNQLTSQPNDTLLEAQLRRSWTIVYRQTRKALPNARIIFTAWALGNGDFGGLTWARYHKFVIKLQLRWVKEQNDPNLLFCGMYMHVDRRGGYPPYVQASNEFGLQDWTSYNALHEDYVNLDLGAEAMVGALSV